MKNFKAILFLLTVSICFSFGSRVSAAKLIEHKVLNATLKAALKVRVVRILMERAIAQTKAIDGFFKKIGGNKLSYVVVNKLVDKILDGGIGQCVIPLHKTKMMIIPIFKESSERHGRDPEKSALWKFFNATGGEKELLEKFKNSLATKEDIQSVLIDFSNLVGDFKDTGIY